jgi:osmoprotectant transport system permease protein
MSQAPAIGGDTSLQRALRVTLIALVFVVGVMSAQLGLVDDMIRFWDDIVFLAEEHIYLVAVSGGLAILAGVPTGVLLSRPFMRRAAESVMQVLNIGTTIPTLAILALSMTLLGIGVVPAIFGLFIASLLPIVRNTYVGIRAVAPHLKEAATGLGMTPMGVLFRVELPNALYVIFAGIRTALTINVGTAPLAYLIGAGGLGELIFQGIALNQTGRMLAGAIPVALLAIAVDFVIAQIQYWAIPRGVNPQR